MIKESRKSSESCKSRFRQWEGEEGMSVWKEFKLGNVSSKVGSGATPTGGENAYKLKGISLIRSQNVYDFMFSNDGLAFIDDKQAYELRNVEVLENDILINITGESVTRCCIVPKQYLPARVNQHVAIIRPIKEIADFKYIFYYLQSIKPELHSIAEIGCTRRALTKGMLEDISILLPPLPEQRAIASVLSSLDDKIDLLHRQNKTLEAMAETLFRQWFIEPSLNPCHREGSADEGWEEDSLLRLVQLVGGGTPKTSIPDYWDGDIPWLAGGDIASNHKSFVLNTEKRITENGLNNSSTKLLPKYATVISARGTVGKYCLLSQPMTFSQSNYGILPQIYNCYFFTYLLINHVVEELQASAYGSVFDTITTTTFKENKVPIPNESEIRSFENSVSPYFHKIFQNKAQIGILEKLRDVLLPKLMCGEVRLKI